MYVVRVSVVPAVWVKVCDENNAVGLLAEDSRLATLVESEVTVLCSEDTVLCILVKLDLTVANSVCNEEIDELADEVLVSKEEICEFTVFIWLNSELIWDLAEDKSVFIDET